MKLQRKILMSRSRKPQAGLTVMETMIALAMLLIVAAGVMGLAAVAVSTTETQGHLAARTAEYAQDKMEQLLALKFCDGVPGTDTTVFPAVVTATGTGLAGLDYLDASGNRATAAGQWEYVRVWQITVPAVPAGSTGLKQITVLTQANHSVGNLAAPQSTVVALKTFPF